MKTNSLCVKLFKKIFYPKTCQIFLTSLLYYKAMAEIILMANNLGRTNDICKKNK